MPPLSALLPPSSWDSHIHITDPTAFPFPSSASTTSGYTPHAASLSSALSNASLLSLPNLVLVQPSTYGFDNSCLLHYLDLINSRTNSHPDASANESDNTARNNAASTNGAAANNRARGVIVLDLGSAGPSDAQLRRYHARGVRGVRINLKSVGRRMEPRELRALLGRYADRLRRAGGGAEGWALQLYVDMRDLHALEEFVDEHISPYYVRSSPQAAEGSGGLKLVVDHMGSPDRIARNLGDMPGWEALRRLMTRE
ncbi:MAG: hypothetical protein LQ340_007825, partial [Diploschistes diacapsis]